MITKITKEDFKAWLDQPCTKFFQQWIAKDKEELKAGCVETIYHNFQNPEASKVSAKVFGTCHGLDRVLDFIRWANEQVIEEREAELLKPEDRKEVEDYIGDHIKFVYGVADENN